ncbi:MAG TPA: hypothetical protein VIK91_22720 [Nannocystis sp.]
MQVGPDVLGVRDEPGLTIVREADGVAFLVRGEPCEIDLREVSVRIGNLGESVDDSGRWSCGAKIQRDLVTAILFERPAKLHVKALPRECLKITGRRRGGGEVYNTAVWDSVTLEITWDVARREVEVEVRRTVDVST